MNTCPEQIVHYMHAYLDGDISQEDEQVLNKHLEECPSCKEIMDGLTDAIDFVEKTEAIQAPIGFVEGVMARLPKEKSQAGMQRWLRRHPFLAAVAVFFILMSVSVFSSFGNDQQFSVTKQPDLIIEGETVIVPEGEVIKGDIVVKNGDLRIEGEVDGNVTVIHGSKYMASTAVVTGTSEEINKVFDWIWFKIKDTFKDVFQMNDEKVPTEE